MINNMKSKIFQILKESVKTINFFVLYVFWATLLYAGCQYIVFGKIATGLTVIIHDHNDKDKGE